ncbi:hypothetical protein [Longimicrobium sp.]|uniref:hypothetical protein n=1 Tax=Longimicrobium sp. TaxID=2029185 RepID=UPI003B3BA1F7
MSANPLQALLDFLLALETRKIFYRLSRPRGEALMVEVAMPGERWEVEFFADGRVETERFVTEGVVWSDPALLDELLKHGA